MKGAVHEGRDLLPLTHRRTGGHRRARDPRRTPGNHKRAGRPTASADHSDRPGCPGRAPVARDALLRGTASLRRRPARGRPGRHHTMPDIVSGPSLTSARTGRAPLRGRTGTRRNRTRQRGGSEGHPHATTPLAERAALLRCLARQRGTVVHASGLRPAGRVWFMVRLRPGPWKDRVAPIPPCPCQDSPGQGVAARHLFARCTPQVSSGGNHSGRLRHIRSPLAGETPGHPFGWTGGLRGPDASSPTSTCTGGLSDAVGRHGAPW